MQPADIALVKTLSDPQVHSDGQRVVFVVSHPDLDGDRNVSALWLWQDDGVRQFSHGPHDSRPRWSPDGRRLAFLRSEDDDAKPQVVVMAADGGEATAITTIDDLALGASEVEWSPDSRRLAIAGTTWLDPATDIDDEERARRPRRVTRLPYRADGKGWLADRHTHVYVANHDGSDLKRLTDGPFHDGQLAWRPDGAAIGFVSARHDRAGLDGASQVFEVDLATTEMRELTSPGGWDWVGWDRDGTALVGGLRDVLDWPGVPTLWRVLDGEPVQLLGGLDRCPFPAAPGVTPVGPQLVTGGLVTAIEDRGTNRVIGVADDGTIHRLVDGPRCVTGVAPPDGLAVDGSAGNLFVILTDTNSPGELYRFTGDEEECLTSFNTGLIDQAGILPVQRYTVARDDVELDTWAVIPQDDGPWPVLLNIHGGPTSQYADTFFDEFQVYASAGYLVVGCNPRGSSGRGTDWARAVKGVWDDVDSVDMLDIRAVADDAIERFEDADPERIGIMGGSYGGFATARIIARDRRFSSAVVERGLLAWESFSGTSDIGPFFDRMFFGPDVADWNRVHHDASPLSDVADVAVPTLVVHSESDWRCPLGQAEQYFVGLLRAGVEAELLVFPDEGHELSRSGSPRHRVERFEAILEWHARHLGA